ncbi:MAG: serine hydrolase [Rickettsiales bacterium]|nr:serine hydrolase [Rickettsiales bacterium]OUV98859.1 MAG: hypothetical protein CBD16_09325 [Betaproteobacteria bacterium TMED156]
MLKNIISFIIFSISFSHYSAFPHNFETVKPELLGVSSERLNRITDVFNKKISEKKIPGYVVLVMRSGKIIFHKAEGKQDPQKNSKMSKESIFRIFSMTKPITSIGTLMLVEQGKIKLTDPVAKYLPELKNMRVAVNQNTAKSAAAIKTKPAKNSIRIIDLLRHTAGFTYGYFKAYPGGGVVEQMYIDAGMHDQNISNKELVTRISKLPLKFEPNTTWYYSNSIEVLGRVIEVITKSSLEEFFQRNIFKPLKMTDTSFRVSDNKFDRFAEPFDSDKQNLILPYSEPTKSIITLEAGGLGLTSTALDYAHFAQMLMNNGNFGGVQILGKKSVELVMTDQLPRSINKGPFYIPGGNQSWSLAGAVRNEGPRHANLLNSEYGSAGEFYWVGYAGTSFFIDPKEELIGIFMSQAANQLLENSTLFKTMVLQSIVK